MMYKISVSKSDHYFGCIAISKDYHSAIILLVHFY